METAEINNEITRIQLLHILVYGADALKNEAFEKLLSINPLNQELAFVVQYCSDSKIKIRAAQQLNEQRTESDYWLTYLIGEAKWVHSIAKIIEELKGMKSKDEVYIKNLDSEYRELIRAYHTLVFRLNEQVKTENEKFNPTRELIGFYFIKTIEDSLNSIKTIAEFLGTYFRICGDENVYSWNYLVEISDNPISFPNDFKIHP